MILTAFNAEEYYFAYNTKFMFKDYQSSWHGRSWYTL